MKKQDLFIGMKLYRSMKDGIEEFTVSAIGNKFFQVAENPRHKITIEDLTYHRKDYYQFNYTFFLTKEEILNKETQNELYDKIKKVFQDYSCKISLKKLNQIEQILNLPD